MNIVIVGAGMAAVRLVEKLVAEGFSDEITLIGDEAHAPYNRILLTDVLAGSRSPTSLTLRSREWYAANGVNLLIGCRVVTIDRDRRAVELADGRSVEYDRLVLATGSTPIVPAIQHPAVHTLRGLDDVGRLLDAVPTTRRATVIGGGLLGLQAARALAVRGVTTEVIEAGQHLLHRRVEPQAGEVLARSLARLGTPVHTGTSAASLLDGPLEADLVVVAAGSRPSTDLAREAGLSVRTGIVVDDRLTSVDDPNVFAIGDCAEHDGRTTGTVAPAWEQAESLARNLAGGSSTYRGSRATARLRATGLDVAVLGRPDETGEIIEMSNSIAGTHRRLVVHDGRIVAATMIGDLSRIGLVTQHFDRGTRLGASEAGALLMPPAVRRGPSAIAESLADDAEVCACAGVPAGVIRSCSSVDQARATTRATTGCGGCLDTVRALVSTRSTSDAPATVSP